MSNRIIRNKVVTILGLLCLILPGVSVAGTVDCTFKPEQVFFGVDEVAGLYASDGIWVCGDDSSGAWKCVGMHLHTGTTQQALDRLANVATSAMVNDRSMTVKIADNISCDLWAYVDMWGAQFYGVWLK